MKGIKKWPGKDIAGYLLLAAGVMMLCRSFALCFCNDIWYDELFTVGMAGHSYGELVRFTAADVHPPLYYCIVKLFVDLCKLIVPGAGTIIPAKIASVFPYFILLLYSLFLIRKRFGAFVCGLFFFCAVAMPQLPAYTVEVRMYGWAMLFVTAAFLHACMLVGADSLLENGQEPGVAWRNEDSPADAGRKWHGAALIAYGLAAAYTQYFAAVAAGMVYLCVLFVFIKKDRGRIKEWLLWVGISAAGYLPWLFVLYRQITAVRENYWILPLTWRSLGGCVKFLMKPAFGDERLNTVLAVILFAAYVGVWLYQVVKLFYNGREKERFWISTAGIAVLGGLVLFGFVASILLRPVFVYRYMISAMGCFWFAFALGLDFVLCKQNERHSEKSRNTNIGMACIAGVALTILIFIVGVRDYRAFMGEEEYKTVNMRETMEALSLIGPQDTVIYNFDQVQAVTAYYLPETAERFLWRAEGEKLIQEIISPCGSMEEVSEIEERLGKARTEGGNLWFIGSFNSRDDIVDEWRKAGLTVEEKGSFLLERYWFNLYKVS